MGPTGYETVTQHTKKNPRQVLGPSQPDSADRPSQLIQRRAMSDLANVKRKLAEIDKERKKICLANRK
jgi:hypothetical protein